MGRRAPVGLGWRRGRGRGLVGHGAAAGMTGGAPCQRQGAAEAG
jgi:hypothetical protein